MMVPCPRKQLVLDLPATERRRLETYLQAVASDRIAKAFLLQDDAPAERRSVSLTLRVAVRGMAHVVLRRIGRFFSRWRIHVAQKRFQRRFVRIRAQLASAVKAIAIRDAELHDLRRNDVLAELVNLRRDLRDGPPRIREELDNLGRNFEVHSRREADVLQYSYALRAAFDAVRASPTQPRHLQRQSSLAVDSSVTTITDSLVLSMS